jgi:hypothetical protein
MLLKQKQISHPRHTKLYFHLLIRREDSRHGGREEHRREEKKKDLLLSLIGYLCEK